MKLTMLGTGNALVTECYNTCFVLEENKKYFMVDGGGGSAVLHQLKHAGFNWMDMREIFITHKHIDHLTGIIWMIRMICQHMNSGKYDGEACIYGHEEVISLLKNMSELLLPKKQTRFIGNRLHLICVSDGETRTINNHLVTFLTLVPPKPNSLDFPWDFPMVRNSSVVVMNLIMTVKNLMSKAVTGFCTKLSACIPKKSSLTLTKSTIQPSKMPANSLQSLTFQTLSSTTQKIRTSRIVRSFTLLKENLIFPAIFIYLTIWNLLKLSKI